MKNAGEMTRSMKPMDGPPRVVIVAPVVPHDAPPHAGGVYLQRVVRAAASLGPTTVVVPNTPANRAILADSAASGLPDDLVVVGLEPATSLAHKAWNRVLTVTDTLLRRVDHGRPPLAMSLALRRPGRLRAAVASADVVDLQWSEQVRLAALVRRVNPRARVVGTFHDVQSQLFAREPARTLRARAFWWGQRRLARRHERRGVSVLDEVATFSPKDARLLGDPPRLRVIHPPLATGSEGPHPPRSGPPTVVFVAHFARPENDDGALWLLREVWPAVRAAVPDARLRLVGRGTSAALGHASDNRPEITLTGFVDDLREEYDAADLAVVPLRQGAGVKFKTVEALLHGVPVVTTSVGAEGIGGRPGDPDLFAGQVDDARLFAGAMVTALTQPGPALARSAAARDWAMRAYALTTFEHELAAHYGLG